MEEGRIDTNTYFINRGLAPSTRMITKASSRRNGSIQTRDLKMRVWWRRTISLKHTVEQPKGQGKNNTTTTLQKTFSNITCILISHGGGAPSGMPRASFSSCDKMPGFISLNFTCIPNEIKRQHIKQGSSYNMQRCQSCWDLIRTLIHLFRKDG